MQAGRFNSTMVSLGPYVRSTTQPDLDRFKSAFAISEIFAVRYS